MAKYIDEHGLNQLAALAVAGGLRNSHRKASDGAGGGSAMPTAGAIWRAICLTPSKYCENKPKLALSAGGRCSEETPAANQASLATAAAVAVVSVRRRPAHAKSNRHLANHPPSVGVIWLKGGDIWRKSATWRSSVDMSRRGRLRLAEVL